MSPVSCGNSLVPHPFGQKLLEEVRNDPGILAVYQYGSSLTSDHYRDIDICIVPIDGGSKGFLPSFFLYSGTYADYGNIPLDITLFSLLPIYIRIQVIREGIVLFLRNREKLFDLILELTREWDDFYPSYRIITS